MPYVYIINTNKKNNISREQEMVNEKKCSAYYSPWKEGIEKIKSNDLVFLYSNEVGIITRGSASGICETKDYEGKIDEEYYMELDRFQELRSPLKASQIDNMFLEDKL